jgi:hypothetical protein
MRLLSYINEEDYSDSYSDDVVPTIKKDCKYYLDILKMYGDGKVFYRGYKGNDDFLRRTPRNDRKPLSTNRKIHDILDDVFKKRFGWKVRSEGVFTSSNKYVGYYGKPYLFFPAGKNIKFVFSPIIQDLYTDLNDYFREIPQLTDGNDVRYFLNNNDYRTIIKVIEKLVNDEYYQNEKFNQALVNDEVVWKCDYYYLVKYDKLIQEWKDGVKGFMRELYK